LDKHASFEMVKNSIQEIDVPTFNAHVRKLKPKKDSVSLFQHFLVIFYSSYRFDARLLGLIPELIISSR